MNAAASRCDHARNAVREAVGLLVDSNLTLSTAESLTGGLASHLVVEEPGSGSVFLGGVVAYSAEVKRRVLRVDADELVSADCALQMATGIRELFGSDCALAFTGVAGPATQEGRPVGTVFIAALCAARSATAHHEFSGPPDDVRAQAVEHGAALLVSVVGR